MILTLVHPNKVSSRIYHFKPSNYYTENGPAYICLQETRHGEKILKSTSGYKIAYSSEKRDEDLGSSVAVLRGKITNYKIKPLNTNLQAIATYIW